MNDQQAASLPPHIEKAFIYALEQMQACEARLSVMIERHQQAWKQVGAEPSVVAEEELSNAQAEMFSGYDEMNLAIEAFDAVLHKYGINPSDFETPLPQQKKRLWEKDLQPEVVPKDSDRMEDGLQSGLQRLLEIFPRAWVKPQLLKGEALMHARGTQEPFLLGGISAEPMMHDRFGYGLTLAIALIERDPHFDMYEAPTLVPQISMLCQLLDALLSVQGGLEKLRELQKAPSGEVDSRIYELLVAARAAEVGRKVSFVPAKPGAPTPDLRIHDMYFPVVIECKLQNRRSEVETVAVAPIEQN